MQIKEFLNNVCEQIKYKPIRSEISEELENHIKESKENYIIEGLDEKVAEEKAIKQMGFSIPKDITSVEELKDYMDEIQTIIDENLEDSFGSFG